MTHPFFDADATRNDEQDDERPDAPAPFPAGAFPPFMVDQQLYNARLVTITGQITQHLARDTVNRLHAMAAAGDDPITVIISSPGGHVESGDMIHDAIRFIKPRVRMLGTGWVASAGAFIYIAAEREDRYSLPNTRFLMHQPSGGVGGQASDVEIQAREIIRMRERINKQFAKATGQSLDKITADTDRDFWLSAEEAVEYGLVGRIIESSDELA